MTAPPFRLMLVTDRTLTPIDTLPQAVRAAVDGGVDAIQVREHGLSHDEMLGLTSDLREAIGGRARLIVNGTYPDASVLGVDGVHLSERAPAANAAQRQGFTVGRSVHSLESALGAEGEGCDYIVLGTVFPSRSHPGGATGGLTLVRRVVRSVSIPVIGIGGISAANAGDLIRAGAAGVAVIAAILASPDPRAAARGIRAAIDAALADSLEEHA